MRTNERKGAWTLLIGVLLFGALVWGLGGHQMREDRAREAASDQQQVVILASDSTADDVDNANGKRSRHARRSRASKKSSKRSASGSASNKSASSAPTRDILADTISLEK